METSDEDIKIIFLSGEIAGKSTLIERILEGRPAYNVDPTIFDTFSKTFEHQNYKLTITDTSYQDIQRFPTMTYYLTLKTLKEHDCYVLVYSIDSRPLFEAITKIYSFIQRSKDSVQFPCVIIGNECDLTQKRVVQKEEGMALAESLGAQFFEVSGWTGEGVHNILGTIIEKYFLKDDPHSKDQHMNSRKEICHIF